MLVPKSVLKLANGLHQDVGLLVKTLDEFADHCVASLTAIEKEEAKTFLSNLLDGSHDTAQIVAFWNSMPKDIRIDNNIQIIILLKHIRDRLPGR